MQKIKIIYTQPEIQEIRLDNEISLTLYSEPPLGPGEELLGYQQSKNCDNSPFFKDKLI